MKHSEQTPPAVPVRLSKSMFFSLFPLLAVWLLFACTPRPEPPLNIGANQWLGYETLYLARTLGYFEQQPIHLVELPSATEVMHAMRSGTLDGAALTLDEALSLIETGVELRVILVLDISNGADALLARPEYPSIQSLRGRRIGVEHKAVGAILLSAALDSAGMDIGDVKILPVAADDHLNAYLSGTVDAVVSFEPVKTRLIAEGAHVLFDSGQIPDRIVDVLVVREDALAAHPKALEALVRGNLTALDYLRSNPRDASERMAPRLRVSPDVLLRAYDGITLPGLADNRRLLAGPEPALREPLDRLAAIMLHSGLLDSRLDLDRLLDANLLPKSRP